jgi:hypothetical protein
MSFFDLVTAGSLNFTRMLYITINERSGVGRLREPTENRICRVQWRPSARPKSAFYGPGGRGVHKKNTHTRLHPTNAEKRKRSQDSYHFTIPYVVASSSDHARTPGLKQTGASNDRNRRRPNDNLITHSEGRKKFRPLEGPATGLERH